MRVEKLKRLHPNCPDELEVRITDQGTGLIWGTLTAMPKQFRKGSVGYFVSGKVRDADQPEYRYQVVASIVLIGSKHVD